MSCGKKPLVKNWDHPRKLTKVTPSKYEKNEASVKLHWKKVLRDLELSLADEQFWESNADQVKELVGPEVFARLAKMFNLPPEKCFYTAKSEDSDMVPSEIIYKGRKHKEEDKDKDKEVKSELTISTTISSVHGQGSEEMVYEETIYEDQQWSSRTETEKSMAFTSSPRLARSSMSRRSSRAYKRSLDDTPFTDDDIEVHPSRIMSHKKQHFNPFHYMLYCCKEEADMIKWKSKYIQKQFVVSASDEFNKKAEILAKKIAFEFYEWWISVGSDDFKTEIKTADDIEALFQVWFDEHASRGLVIHPKIIPCVLKTISAFVDIPKYSCEQVLNKQVAYDIRSEFDPAHLTAFNTSLPQKMKHIPPNNNTKKLWHSVVIPEDLRTFSFVWDDIMHLTSTKTFKDWLKKYPHLRIPGCFRSDSEKRKTQRFVIPSDIIFRDNVATAISNYDLALPVSEFNLELNEELHKLLDI